MSATSRRSVSGLRAGVGTPEGDRRHRGDQAATARTRSGVSPGMDHPRYLPRAPLVSRFRDALARRRAGDVSVFATEASSALRCRACLEATAAALEARLERLEPHESEVGVLEPYD